MDLDINLFLNFIPIISTVILTFVTWIIVFYKLKNRWPIKVNCWFCNKNAKIEKESIDWWLCPHCNQYNGFSEDGDYNYIIPEQYRVAKENTVKHKSYCQRKDISMMQNSLCKQCNRKEELKLSKLRELEDSIDVYNDKQIARFESSFEQKYPLCLKCQTIVTNVLHKQTLWLIQYKMLLFKQKPIRRLIEHREKIERILRIFLSILALITIYFTEASYFPLCGIFFQLAACLASSINKRQSDIFPIFGWACLVFIRAFSTSTILRMFKIYSNDDSTTVEDNTYQYFVITLGIAIGLANFKFKSHNMISNEFLTFKKLESPNKNIFMSRSSSPDTATLPNEKANPICNKDPMRNFYSPVNLTDALITPSTIETPILFKPTNFSQWSYEEKAYHAPSYISPRGSTLAFEQENSFPKALVNRNYNLNDSLSSLNSLSLGTQERTSKLNFPRVFETRIYGTTSSDLFNKHQRYSQKRSILAPAKLRLVTQTSWVAGGYWQTGMDTPTLSRSSSQSSGFGSSGSNCGPSREPSVHEFDQYSVASEHCCFARPESPLSAKTSNLVKRRGDSFPTCSQMNEITYDTESYKYHPKNDTHCNGHTTIIRNSVWLPILLCTSLLFNMIVLCTILLC